MADVFGKTISVPDEPEGSVFGAAILEMYALGIIKILKKQRILSIAKLQRTWN